MKKPIEEHIRKNIKTYLYLAILFLIGIMIGIFFINNTKNEVKEEIKNYILNFISNIKTNNTINYSELLKKTLTENIQYVLLIIAISFSIWGKFANSLLIGYKGFSLGYIMSAVISMMGIKNGVALIISLVLVNQIILIPTFFYVITSSSKVYNRLIKEEYDRKKNLILKYLISLGASVLLILIASLIQTYLNSNLFLFLLKYY